MSDSEESSRADSSPKACEISVIITIRHRREILLETLSRLDRQAGDTGSEVIVVDDGSSDGTIEAVRAFAEQTTLSIRILEQAGAGPAAARNRGLEAAHAPTCLLMGDDTWPVPGLLARHSAFHRQHPEREDVLLGRVAWAPPLDRSPFIRWLEQSGAQFGFHPPGHESLRASFFYTANVSAKTDFLRAVGGFDEAFAHAAGEDIELGLRLERAGMRLAYDPDALVEHHQPTELATVLRRMWTAGQARRVIVERFPGWHGPRPPGWRHRAKSAALTSLNLLPRRPGGVREATWRFLCHEAFRESFWAGERAPPQTLPRVGRPLARLAIRRASRPPRIGLNQLLRYEPVLALVRERNGGKLLDVGSGSSGLAPWLGPRWSVTAVDSDFDDYGVAPVEFADTAHRLVADARDLPFPDGSFDVTVAVDFMEHVPAADRPLVLEEMCRVTAGRLVVAGPAGGEALAADGRLADLYARNAGRLPGWLDEHLELGFPEPSEIEAALRPHGWVRLLGNESVAAHERVMRAEARRPSRVVTQLVRAALIGSARDGGRPRSKRAARLLLGLVRGCDRPPTYRTIAVLDVKVPSAGDAASQSRLSNGPDRTRHGKPNLP